MRNMKRFWNAAFVMAAIVSFASAAQAQNDAIWIESQNTASLNAQNSDKLKIQTSGWGHSEFLSGGSWFQISADAANVGSAIPADGLVLNYKFNASKAANYQIWNRIGYEFVRSPFDWRLDNGAWNPISPDQLTTDLMELQDWNEVAWLQLGAQQLNAGDHTLEIRLPKTKDAKGATQRILYASDAIAIVPGEFHPNGKWKPGENFRTATDEAATNHVFALPDATSSTRSSVKLAGDWEVARDDEQTPVEVATPMTNLSPELHWTAIAVPSDKNAARPDLLMAHRLWYRTHVDVPANQSGRSFFLDFPLNSLNTTVVVNGQLCGFNKNPLAPFQIDVSKAIKSGNNEIRVGIRDAWYGRTANPADPLKLRRTFNLPMGFFGQGFQDLAYPIWNNAQSGMLEAPTLVSAGSTYASDVFVKPSVANHQLAAQITLTNSTNANVSGEVRWAALDASGAVAKSFAPKTFTIGANANRVLDVAESWPNAKLWWPDQPNLYTLRTTVVINNKIVDAKDTQFGFREWATRGTQFTLNGIKWPMWADLTPLGANDTASFLKSYRDTNQRTFRLMMPGQGGGSWRYLAMPLRDVLSFFDKSGVTVRRNGTLDGEAIGYAFSENDAAMKARNNGSEMKVDLMNNWRDQMLQQVRGERNHASIQIWSPENEFAYINLINLLGNGPLMDEYEHKITDVVNVIQAEDPTRPVMIDGGGATKFQTLPVHGNHYVFNPSDTRYPDLAYQANPEGGGRGRWIWDQKRPRFIGEDYFATGINPADYAQWGGESAFLSKAAARPAGDFLYRMLTEGYRWSGQSAWQFWSGAGEVVNPWNSQSPRAVFVRQYDTTFGSGQKVVRTFGIFNDSEYNAPLTFNRVLESGGKTVWSKTTIHTIAPGENSKFDETIPMPNVTTRQNARLILTLSAAGKEVFRDVKMLSILPRVATLGSSATALKPSVQRTSFEAVTESNAQIVAGLNAKNLFVYDPNGSTIAFLKNSGQTFTMLNSLANLPATGRVLVIGEDALTVEQSTSSALAAWASSGRSVVVLDQKNPLKYQAITADMDVAPATSRNEFGEEISVSSGALAFPEDLNHPAMRGLQSGDFMGWAPDNAVYRSAYLKPIRGARSLVQCGPRLAQTALVEVPTGKGVMLLSQLLVGEKLGNNAVAQQLMSNLLAYGATYKQVFRAVSLVSSGDAQLTKAADAIGLQYSNANDALTAISNPATKLAIIEATPANLQQLSANMTKLNAFMQSGGYVVFHGLSAAGLDDYNKIVGFNHMIRPMRRERVQLSTPRNPLSAGLTLGDVVMLSGERIFPWTADEYVADDIFSAIVDYDDVAPFGTTDNYLYNNAVNGFFQADGWKLINNFDAPKSGAAELSFKLSKPQTITEWTWVGNTLYNGQTKVGLVIDGKKQSWNVLPTADPQTLTLNPPLSGQNVTVQILDWQHLPGKQGGSGNDVIGLDNIYLKAARPADFYNRVKPLLNVGGLIQYPRGNGGMVLCNLLFRDSEAVPVNATKKLNIFSAILRNLNAPFAVGKTIIAGAGLNYTPIDIHNQATQYRNDKGWFGNKNFTFNALPTGKQVFGGIEYSIYDFPTSPVPTAIMLGSDGIPNNPPQQVMGIPVHQKADALFFLQTARIDNRMNDDDRKNNRRFEMARYIVHYADGQSATIPIYAETDIENYRQAQPTAISGAQIAWTSKFANSNDYAVAYTKQWNNPRPDVAIASVDMTYGADRRGVPVLLALTAAKQ